MRKIFLISVIFILLLTGCFHKQKTPMDQPAEDGKFHYQNKDLGFVITLPPEFQYYQTQRKETNDFTDLEFFVPTSDASYQFEVTGYGKPIIVRIFEKQAWEAVGAGDKASFYNEIGEKDEKVFTVKFWKNVPIDWQVKWNIDMEKGILESFEIK